RTGASQSAQTTADFGKGRCRMDHRLFVAGLVVAKVRILLKRLTNTSHVAMPKDAETTGKELRFSPITFNMLRLEKFDDGLRHTESNRFHSHLQTEKFRL